MVRTSTFAERLRFIMLEKNITKSQLAKAIGIDKANITRYLKGDYEAKQDVVYRLASVLKVTEAWLMGYDAPMLADDPRIKIEKQLFTNGVELSEVKRRLINMISDLPEDRAQALLTLLETAARDQ